MTPAAVGWLVVIAYEVVALMAARMAFPYILEDGGGDEPVDRFLAALLVLIGVQFWPLAAPIALILWKPRKTPEQVQEENRRMKQHIAELERELGIGGRP